jgi:hypothetical protein
MLQHADTIRVIAWTNYDGGHGTSSASLLEVAMAGELERSAKMIFFMVRWRIIMVINLIFFRASKSRWVKMDLLLMLRSRVFVDVEVTRYAAIDASGKWVAPLTK